MRLFLHELRAQQRMFWRSTELAFFTFLLPIIFFTLLGSVYGDDEIEGVRGAGYLLAGMLGYGVAATAFAGVAIVLVNRREAGILKRVRATPLPPATYVAALLGSTLIAFAVEAACLLAFGRLFFDIGIPDPLLSLVLALVLGAIAFSALGVALAAVVRSAEGSSAVVNAVYLPMAFISGSFFSPDQFPGVLQAIAEVLPLTHFIRILRDVILYGGELWDDAGAVAVVAAWGVLGVLVAVRRFRWEPRTR